jgi:cytochrome oxidase Cu insertion factor (SCO1/SenC/PrrC family)
MVGDHRCLIYVAAHSVARRARVLGCVGRNGPSGEAALSEALKKVPLPGGDYTMDHRVAIYALDKRASVRLMFTMNRPLEDIADDILELLREAS